MITVQNNIHILLIEDDLDDIELMESTLNISNRRNTTQLRLTAFTTITAAFHTFHANQYDIILLDLNLGTTMGVETLTEVRAQQQQLPIIVLTGLSATHIGLECIRHGASDYLIKRKLYTNQLVSNQFLLKPIQYAIERNKLTQQIYHQKQTIEKSYKELQQLAFHASHDLKEPISTMIRFLQYFQSHYTQQLNENAQQTMQFILEQAFLQNKHIESLLKYLTIEQESVSVHKIDLIQLLNQLLQQWKTKQVNSTNIQLTYQTIPSLTSNAPYIIAILTELWDNALCYKHSERPLHIEVNIGEKWNDHILIGWLIQVKDNGQGFAMEHAPLIFELFKTLQPKANSNCVGAGLALVQKMVRQLKGTIWVESEVGKGSTFFVELPKLPKE